MLPTGDTTTTFSLLPPKYEEMSDSLLQEMADDDDFFFEPLPLERQETIYGDVSTSAYRCITRAENGTQEIPSLRP